MEVVAPGTHSGNIKKPHLARLLKTRRGGGGGKAV